MGRYQALIRQYAKLQVEKDREFAVLYLVKTDCQWRNLPHDSPPVFTVHSFYRRARLNGLWDRILEHLVKLTRQKARLSESPTQVLIDSQSVKTTGAV